MLGQECEFRFNGSSCASDWALPSRYGSPKPRLHLLKRWLREKEII